MRYDEFMTEKVRINVETRWTVSENRNSVFQLHGMTDKLMPQGWMLTEF